MINVVGKFIPNLYISFSNFKVISLSNLSLEFSTLIYLIKIYYKLLMKINKKQDNNKKSRISYKTWGFTFAFMLIIFLTYRAFFQGQYSFFTLLEDRERFKQKEIELIELEKKIVESEKEFNLLEKRDPFEMEKKARENNMTKPGEKVYRYNIVKEDKQ